MKIAVVTIGTRGDVQPYIALTKGLQHAGYDVTLATHGEFEDFVRAHGLKFAPVAGNPRELLETETGRKWLESSTNPVKFLRGVRKLAGDNLDATLKTVIAGTSDIDLFISSPLALFATQHIAEKRGLPNILAAVAPFYPTRYITSPTFPPRPAWFPFEGLYNRLSYTLNRELLWLLFGSLTNKIRREYFDLPPINSSRWTADSGMPVLHGYSAAVIPRPSDWPDHAYVAGYWFLDEPDYVPPTALVDFLNDGPAPVYVGFGSMSDREPQETLRLILDALDQAGQRGIILSGWAGYQDAALPKNVYSIDSIPHSWLFPRMAAVVHHGGAGTTAAGLRAGVSSIVVPFFADQPFWASRVQSLGVGPTPIPRKQLTAKRLAEAIRAAVSDHAMQDRARSLGEQIRSEDGVGNAVEIVGQFVRQHESGAAEPA